MGLNFLERNRQAVARVLGWGEDTRTLLEYLRFFGLIAEEEQKVAGLCSRSEG
jgi:hypothetical protein